MDPTPCRGWWGGGVSPTPVPGPARRFLLLHSLTGPREAFKDQAAGVVSSVTLGHFTFSHPS